MLDVETGVSPLKAKLVGAFAAVYVLWGSTYLAIRFGVETIPPFLHAAVRFLLSGCLLFIWRRAAGDPAPTTPAPSFTARGGCKCGRPGL